MYFTHADEKSLNGIDIIDKMKGKKRDINIFPSDWLDQIKHRLA